LSGGFSDLIEDVPVSQPLLQDPFLHVFRCEQTVFLFRVKKEVHALKSIPGFEGNPQEAVMSSDNPNVQNSIRRFRILGGFWAVYGVIRLMIVLCLLIYGRTATLMFGALLNRVPDPFALMGVFHFLYTVMIVLSAVCGFIGFVAGVALMAGQRSSRRLALIAAVLSVCDIPLGTTLGIYTLVELLPVTTMQLFARSGHAT
jgi:hypothetical protein